jgi:uncharacterized membrane protein YeiB
MLISALEALVRRPLFRRGRSPECSWDVIAWWESRRIPYNLIVGAAGIASAIVMLIMGFATEPVVGDNLGSPLFAIFAVTMYGIMANICFTAGWVLELLSRRIWGTRAEAFGEIAFTWGTLASVIVTLIPAGVNVCRRGLSDSCQRLEELTNRLFPASTPMLALANAW